MTGKDEIKKPPVKKWKKPVVSSSKLTANVYSMEGTIKISE